MILHDELAEDLENIDKGNSDNPFPSNMCSLWRTFSTELLESKVPMNIFSLHGDLKEHL